MANELTVSFKIKNMEKELQALKKKLQETWDEAEKNIWDDTAKWAKKAENALSGLKAKLAWIFAIGAITGFISKLINLWSALDETTSKFNVVFKDSAPWFRKELVKISKATWLAEKDLLAYSASIWDLLNPLWFTTDASALFSKEIVKLAWDLSSFQNIPFEDAFSRIQSWLVGEREGLKTLGIVIDEATLKQKALDIARREGVSETDKATRALATYELLLENTSDAQTDLTRTQESFANQSRRTSAIISDNFAKAWITISQVWWRVLSAFNDILAVVLPQIRQAVWSFLNIVWSLYDNFTNLITRGYTFVKNNIVWISQAIVTAFVLAIAVMQRATINSFLNGVASVMVKGFSAIRTANLASIQAMVVNTATTIKNSVVKKANAVATWVQTTANKIASLSFLWMAKAIWVATLSTLLLTAKFVAIGAVVALVVWAIYKNWERISKALSPIFEAIARAWQAAPSFIAKARNGLVDVVLWSVETILTGVTWVAKAIESLTWVSVWWDALAGITQSLWRLQNNLKISEQDVSWFFTGIKDGAVWAFEAVTSLGDIGGIVDNYDAWFADISSIMQAQWDQAFKTWADTKKAMESGADGAKTLEEQVDDTSDALENAESTLKDLEEAEKDVEKAWKKMARSLQDWLEDVQRRMEDLRSEYDDLVTDINNQEADDLNNETQSFVRDQVWNEKKLQDDIADIQERLAELRQRDWDNQERINDLLQEEIEKRKELEQVQKNLASLEWERNAWLVDAERERANLSDAERDLFDFQQTQNQIKTDAQAERDEAKATFDEKQSLLEQEASLIKFFQVAEAEQIRQLQQLRDEWLLNFSDKQQQDMFDRMLNERLEYESLVDAKISLEQKLARQVILLNNWVTTVLKWNVQSLNSDYQQLVNTINQAIAAESRLQSARASQRFQWWPVEAWKPYLVWENPDGTINKTTEMVVPNQGWYVLSASKLREIARSSVDRSKTVKIDKFINTRREKPSDLIGRLTRRL